MQLIRDHEGLRTQAYRDAVGVPTIGYGHIRGVKMGDTCSPAQAEAFLADDVAPKEECVRQFVAVPLSQNQFDALVSFVFNLGCESLHKSTLLRLLNAGNYGGAAGQFEAWDHAGGHVVTGLLKRRQDERALFEETA